MLWVYLTGLYRTFPLNARGNLPAFLDASSSTTTAPASTTTGTSTTAATATASTTADASGVSPPPLSPPPPAPSPCWFVVLYTLETIERTDPSGPWWCGYSSAPAACTRHAAAAANRSAAAEIDDAVAPLRANPESGGVAYVVATRSHEPKDTNTAVLQNFAAVAMLGRAVLRTHGHGLSSSSSPAHTAANPSDVILISRPDIVYNAAIDAPKLASLVRRMPSTSPLLLVLRHGWTEGRAGVNNRDPSDTVWIASRAALDALCPDGAGCLGGRRALDVHRQGCGHPFATLLVHASTALGIATFYVPIGWRVMLHRLGGDRARGYNGPDDNDLPAAHSPTQRSLPSGTPRHDLTRGLRCAVGRDQRSNTSACRKDAAPETTSTRWGVARRSTFAYNGRYYVCEGTLDFEELLRRAHGSSSAGSDAAP